MDFRSLLNPGSLPPTAMSPPCSRMSLDALLGTSTVHSSASLPFHGSTVSPFHDPAAERTTRGDDDSEEEEEDAIALAGGGTLYFGKDRRRASAGSAAPSEGVPAPQLAEEERQHEELPSIALPSEDAPMELDDPIPFSSRQPYRPAAPDAMDLDPVPSPSPSSSHLVPDSDVDADGEEDPSSAFSGAPEPAIKPEDLEVDMMSHDSSESPPPQLRVRPSSAPLSRSKLTAISAPPFTEAQEGDPSAEESRTRQGRQSASSSLRLPLHRLPPFPLPRALPRRRRTERRDDARRISRRIERAGADAVRVPLRRGRGEDRKSVV